MAKFRSAQQARNGIEEWLDSTANLFLDDFVDEVKRTTPTNTGRARRAWRRRNKYRAARRGDTTIAENKTPYIGLLDEGASDQAPRGMTGPAFDKLKNRRYRKTR